MADIFFIGDLHLGHKNIMNFGQRNFDTMEAHNQALMDNWNGVVTKQHDLVWVLGDVAMQIEDLELLRAFNGRKILVHGNHDKFDTQVYLKYFEKVVAFEKRYHGLVMTHIPIHPNELQYRNWEFNIHGHIHDKKKFPYDPRYINVCADLINLTPICLDEVQTIMTDRRGEIDG